MTGIHAKLAGSISLLSPLALVLLASAAVLALWTALLRDHQTRVEDIVDSVSYAARSETARQLVVQFATLDRIRDYWSDHAEIPVDRWDHGAVVGIGGFPGLDTLAWAERDGRRLYSSRTDFALGIASTEIDRARIDPLVSEALAAMTDTVAGPSIDDEGHAVYRLYLPSRVGDREAVLIAVIDATEQLAAILEDAAPNYDVLITCCDGLSLLRTGGHGAAVPDNWVRGGWIQPIEALRWHIEHRPSAELASDFRPWALNSVLVVGIALACALGLLGFHIRRADAGADAARRAEREVRALNAELEQRVLERTNKLKDALADLNTISLSVGHDIRSPLNAAGLTVESLLMTPRSESGLSARLQRIKSSLDQITLLLDRLTALSRASSFEARRESVDMRALVAEVRDELAADVEIEIGRLPPASADPTMVHILLTNLLGNAARHGNAERKAGIVVGSREEAGRTVYFVRDHGPGVDSACRAGLFEPSAMRKRPGEPGGGLGIGLAIAARVARRHGGDIWIEDTPGGGATFCFVLTAAADPPAYFASSHSTRFASANDQSSSRSTTAST